MTVVPAVPSTGVGTVGPAAGRYRYRLTRYLGLSGGPTVTFVMLNPSTADDQRDDPTIRRCTRFAVRFGAGRLVVINLYALRTTRPAGLWAHPDPVGPDNPAAIDQALTAAAATNGPVIAAAWGCHTRHDQVTNPLTPPAGTRCPLHFQGVTRAGAPRHAPPRRRTPTAVAGGGHRPDLSAGCE